MPHGPQGQETLLSTSMGLAQRRHHRARMVARAKWVIKHRWSGLRQPEASVTSWNYPQAYAQKMADNLKSCACWACSNQRRVFGERFSERRRAMLGT